jgi:2-keto-4-pentenoate hydratase/2-oxohepta-3-ene-1,7-dioic acid hydratase in catechol pathway
MDKLICVGKNYLEHAKELGDALGERPVLFLKPPSVAVFAKHHGETVEASLPVGHGSIHHECEIVIRLIPEVSRLFSAGSILTPEVAAGAIEAVTLGLDMTLRDVQGRLKKSGGPWEISKVFPCSAIIGPWLGISEFSDYLEQDFSFQVDGKIRQRGRGREMRFSPAECISYASEFFPLRGGDIVFTGTPAGVGAVHPGETAELRWGNRLDYRVRWK